MTNVSIYFPNAFSFTFHFHQDSRLKNKVYSICHQEIKERYCGAPRFETKIAPARESRVETNCKSRCKYITLMLNQDRSKERLHEKCFQAKIVNFSLLKRL